MAIFAIYHILLIAWFVSFNPNSYSAPIGSEIYTYDGVKIPDDCKEAIRKNSLLHLEKLPEFKYMSPTDIKTAYECVKKVYRENRKHLDQLSKDKRIKYVSGIEITLEYTRAIKDAMLKNNFTEELSIMNKHLDTRTDPYQKLYIRINEISEEYQTNLRDSELYMDGLLTKKDEFVDAMDYGQVNLEEWSTAANLELGYDGNWKDGPWLIMYDDFENIVQTTNSDELRQRLLQEMLRVGDMKDAYISNEKPVEDLRELYTRIAYKSNYKNIVKMKMKTCFAKRFEDINKFLLDVEETLALKQNDDKHSNIKYSEPIYFSQQHVMVKLLKLIKENFEIHISEYKSYYQVYADGMKLYEVHNELNEKVGLFYIDFNDREYFKVAKSPYVQTLRSRVKKLNIIPIVLVSLQSKYRNKFTLNEVRVLFHEIGHCLQEIFADDNNKISISYDTFEFASKFMELFTYERDFISQLSSKPPQRLLKEYDDYHNNFFLSRRYTFIELLQVSITDLNLFARPEEHCRSIIEDVRNKFKFKKTCDRTFQSAGFPQSTIYAGTLYTYPLAHILATDAYKHLHSDSSKVKERALEFRRLVFEMKGVDTIAKAFQKFVGRKEIDIEPFYTFWGINNIKGLINI